MRAIGIVTFWIIVDVIQNPEYLSLEVVVLQLVLFVLLNEFQKMLVLWFA